MHFMCRKEHGYKFAIQKTLDTPWGDLDAKMISINACHIKFPISGSGNSPVHAGGVAGTVESYKSYTDETYARLLITSPSMRITLSEVHFYGQGSLARENTYVAKEVNVLIRETA